MTRHFLPLVLATALAPWSVLRADGLSAASYIQDGLIAQWDGIENAGYGVHDVAAINWTELKQNLPTTATQLFFDGNSAIFNGTASTGTSVAGSLPEALAAIKNGAFSVDCCFLPNSYTQYTGLFHFGLSGSDRYFSLSADYAVNSTTMPSFIGAFQYKRNAWDETNCRSHTLAPVGQLSCVAAVASNSVHRLYLDGTNTSARSAGSYVNYPNTSFYFGRYAGNTPRANMNLYSMRFYTRVLTPEEILKNAMIDYARFMPSGTVTYTGEAPDGYAECRIAFDSADTTRGTVSCQVAGVGKAGPELFVKFGEEVELTATPKTGYKFMRWTGDVEGIDVTSATVTFPSRVRRLTAWFVATTSAATERKWTGNGGTSYWDVADNWDPSGVPAADDFVTIDKAGAAVTLRTSTAAISTLTIAGTSSSSAQLVFNNWTTQLNAKEITVGEYGVLTCAQTQYNNSMSNRVNLVCRDLHVKKNGKINVNEKGYMNNNGPAWAEISGTIAASTPGAHGGLGGSGEGAALPKCCGSLSEPECPGSGGYRHSSGNGSLGGGAIKIAATRHVRIDGAVTARGQGQKSGTYGGAAGGSIWISSQTSCGQGEVDAGSDDSATNGTFPTSGQNGGGGGRVAIHYDAAKQASRDGECLLSFGARGGCGYYGIANYYNYNYSKDLGYVPPQAWIIGQGQNGTLWFTDYRFLTNSVRMAHNVGLSGRFYSGVALPAELHLAGPARFYNSCLEFDTPIEELNLDGGAFMKGTYYITSGLIVTNSAVKIHGDVTVSGAQIKQIGGTVEIDGDFTMTNSTITTSAYANYAGRLDVQAMDMTGTDAEFGAYFRVKGTWTMNRYTIAYPRMELSTGYVPYFDCLNFDMRPDSYFDALRFGWPAGKGPGYGKGTVGASHGGTGGTNNSGYKERIAPVYGDEKRPITCGSGSSNTQPGGGAICVRARNRMDLNGYLLANGNSWLMSAQASSGGSVFLTAARFASTNGYISVRGGRTNNNGYGCGGGGRVSICARALLSTNVTIFVAGGVPNTGTVALPAQPGTLYWFDNGGAMFLVK